MKQRVNIQYSVDLDDLEIEVVRMIKETGNKLEGYGEDLGHLVGLSSDEQSLTLRMLEELTSVREQIMKVDYSLVDIINIISSYVHYKSKPEESPEMDFDLEDIKEKMQDAQAPNMDQLENLINNFKGTSEENEVSD
tara:strand:- start:1052 stop:1462 length:411 start_codon:yes stop_codon:yes gene_type:complete